jgi:hypothetical protein
VLEWAGRRFIDAWHVYDAASRSEVNSECHHRCVRLDSRCHVLINGVMADFASRVGGRLREAVTGHDADYGGGPWVLIPTGFMAMQDISTTPKLHTQGF